MTETDTTKCPICHKQIEGYINHRYLRKGASFTGKALAKYGAGAVGGAVGSVLGPVGSIMGSSIAKVFARDYSEEGINYLQDKYTTQYYNYYCPDCSIEWKSTDEIREVIRSYYIAQHDANKGKLKKRIFLSLLPYYVLFGIEVLCLMAFIFCWLLGDGQMAWDQMVVPVWHWIVQFTKYCGVLYIIWFSFSIIDWKKNSSTIDGEWSRCLNRNGIIR